MGVRNSAADVTQTTEFKTDKRARFKLKIPVIF